MTDVSKATTETRCLEVKSAADRADALTQSPQATPMPPSAHSSPAATMWFATVIPDTLAPSAMFAMTTTSEAQTSQVVLASSASATTTLTWAVLGTAMRGQENVSSACTKPMVTTANTARTDIMVTPCDKIAEVSLIKLVFCRVTNRLPFQLANAMFSEQMEHSGTAIATPVNVHACLM